MGAFLDTVNGLPVHPLIVHAAIVLVPLAAVGAVLVACRSAWDRRFGVVVVLVALVAAGASVLAKESGEHLARTLGLPEPHAQLGNRMPLIAGALFAAVLLLWLFDRGVPGNRRRPWWLVLLAILTVVVAVLAVWWTWRTGESGAATVWQPIMQRGHV